MELTPETSYGYAVIAFARDVLGAPLDPWQEWIAIHAGELLPDGRPRFRRVLTVVARQNGKTHLLVVLTLYWMFVERQELTLGMSTNLSYAQEPWEKAVQYALNNELLSRYVAPDGVRRANGEQMLRTLDRCRYRIAASNSRGGRGLSVDRLISDELREQRDWKAYEAAYPAQAARPNAQAWFITNQGDESSVVLIGLRESAIEFIESGKGDPRLGIFEYSAKPGTAATDPQGHAYANPNLGLRIDPTDLMNEATTAMARGGEELAGFLTERLCMMVPKMDAAVDFQAWERCTLAGDLSDATDVVLLADVSVDGMHSTVVAAAVDADDRVRLEVVQAWEGNNCVNDLRQALPGMIDLIRPYVVGWFPGGPAAAMVSDLRDRKKMPWPPPGVKVEEIRGEAAAACMGFAEAVQAGRVVHSGDPLLSAHVLGAEKLWTGDVWRFRRRGGGACDAAYAAAGATLLARSVPPRQTLRLITSKEGY